VLTVAVAQEHHAEHLVVTVCHLDLDFEIVATIDLVELVG
jgi:hypothetical protein